MDGSAGPSSDSDGDNHPTALQGPHPADRQGAPHSWEVGMVAQLLQNMGCRLGCPWKTWGADWRVPWVDCGRLSGPAEKGEGADAELELRGESGGRGNVTPTCTHRYCHTLAQVHSAPIAWLSCMRTYVHTHILPHFLLQLKNHIAI